MKKFMFMLVVMMMVIISGVGGYALASSDKEVKSAKASSATSESKDVEKTAKDDEEAIDIFVEMTNMMKDMKAEKFTFEGETLVMVTYYEDGEPCIGEVFDVEEIRDEFKKLGDL